MVQPQGEALMPVYDEEGTVVAWERSMAPERLQAMQPNTHLGEMIGAWAGRQAEEELAQGFNQLLVQRLKDAYDKGRREGRGNEFVNLADPDLKDEVYKDAWKVVPVEMRKQIENTFGEGQFYVRRDMINNAVGYREASVGDAWLGTSRMDEGTRKALQNAATAVLGKNAFKTLVTAEKAWQAGVSVAKNTIVIRSVNSTKLHERTGRRTFCWFR